MSPVARLAFTAAAVPALIALELAVPRRRAPVQWRAIAVGGMLLAVNTALAHVLAIVPDSESVLRIVAAWVLVEIASYWMHRAMHRVPLLWRFHRVHHAPGLVAWHRSWWIHPVDIALFALATDAACLVVGAPHTAAAWLIVVRRVWSLLLHANVAWPHSAADQVLVTPSFHDRHHREDLPPANFAANFSIVDRMFGTWVRP
jgi:sterol desaturase/sphingolipid hydroxylase (fatty acid hydroxylase superfamily)